MTAAVGLRFTQRCRLRRSYIARAETVALDVVLAVLGADVTRQHLQTALGSSVRAHGLATEFGHHGADIDDLTFAALHHLRQHGCADDIGGYEVNVDHLLELFPLHLVHRNALDDTGVVDEDVDGSDLCVDTFHQRLNRYFICHVAHVPVHVPYTFRAIELQRLVDSFLTAGVENELISTCLCKRFGDREADAVAPAGHPCVLAFQRKKIVHMIVGLQFEAAKVQQILHICKF